MQYRQLSLFTIDKYYPSVKNDEKRAQLEAEGIPWPVCSCCGVELKWNPRRCKKGGEFQKRCVVREKEKRAGKRHIRTPGMFAYEESLRKITQRMQKYIEGTPENIEYKEKIKARWLTKLNEHS